MLRLEDIKQPYIGSKFRPIEVLPMSFLETSYALGHRRLMVFSRKGVHCANEGCDKVGVHLIKALDNGGAEHIDVYTADFELMTVDHILPRSHKGRDTLENKQPMCSTCNSRKGSKIPAHLLEEAESK